MDNFVLIDRVRGAWGDRQGPRTSLNVGGLKRA